MHKDAEPAGGPVRIALLGYGTVGRALHEALVVHSTLIAESTGHAFHVDTALVRDAATPREAPRAPIELVDDIDRIIARNPHIVCEAMGGTDDAFDHVIGFLRRGVPVVTANKQLIARRGAELFAAAASAGTELRFEASVCGAVPIVRVLRESLAPARIDRVVGILNGTTNFMLSSMADDGRTYAEALADAQRLGYAEADPSDDVDGVDAAAKLAILAGIAFGTSVDPDSIDVRGLGSLDDVDIAFAAELGCRVKLVGSAQRLSGDAIDLAVAPTLVEDHHPLAAVGGATNAVVVEGDPFGRIVLEGAGAGGPETASAMAGDVVSVADSSATHRTGDPRVRDLVRAAPEARALHRWYVRLEVDDEPGVLAGAARALADADVSIERVVQRPAGAAASTLVLTTHHTRGAQVRSALDALGSSVDGSALLPILDSE